MFVCRFFEDRMVKMVGNEFLHEEGDELVTKFVHPKRLTEVKKTSALEVKRIEDIADVGSDESVGDSGFSSFLDVDGCGELNEASEEDASLFEVVDEIGSVDFTMSQMRELISKGV